MKVAILTNLLNAFVHAFTGWAERIQPSVNFLLYTFLTIDVFLFGFGLLFELEQVKSAFKKTLSLSVWLYIIQSFPTIANGVVDSLVQAGMLLAGNAGTDPRTVFNPSQILSLGFDATSGLTKNLLVTTLLDPLNALSYVVSFIIIMAAFIALAINVLMALLDYYMALAAGTLLVAFTIFGPTRWIGLAPMKFVVSSGVKLMMIAFVMSVSATVVTQDTFVVQDQTLQDIWVRVCVSMTMALLAWVAPQRFVHGLLNGASALGGSDVSSAVSHVLPHGTGSAAARGAGRVLGNARSVMGMAAQAGMAAYKNMNSSGGSSPAAGKAGSPAAAGLMKSATASPQLAAARPPELVGQFDDPPPPAPQGT